MLTKDIEELKRNRMNIRFKYSLLFIILLFFIVSCSKKELDPIKYIQWVENEQNGLSIDKEIGDLIFNVQYQPLDYVILRQNQKTSIDSESYKKIKGEVEGLLYFNFSISTIKDQKSPLYYNISAAEEYQYRVSYFSFEVSNDFKLVIANDSLPCVLHHFERTYNIIPKVTFVLAFEKPENFSEESLRNDFQFIYNDKIFDVGKIQIKLENKKIRRIPKLNIITYVTEN